MCVVGSPVPDHLGVDRGAAGLRGRELLEHEDACTFPHHEARPRGVERAHREGRVDVLRDQPPHRTEAGEDELDDRRLRPPCENNVGLAADDHRRALADRGRAGARTPTPGRVVRPRDAELDRDLAARGVDERRGNEERRDPVAAALDQRVLLVGDRGDAADCGADENPDPRR